jgi:hypothetical protein
MWTCLNCETENADAVTACPKCGLLRTIEKVQTWLTQKDIFIDHPQKNTLFKTVGLPRQFSVGTLLVLMTFYAVLFSLLKLFDTDGPIFAGFAVYFTGVGLGQMIFFHSRSPRMASYFSGLIAGILSSMVVLLLTAFLTPKDSTNDAALVIYCVGFCFLGGPLGYFAGCLIAGIFLFRECEEQAAESEENETK